MIAKSEVYMKCDKCFTPLQKDGGIYFRYEKYEIIKEAKLQHWNVIAERHICPKCSEEEGIKKPEAATSGLANSINS